MGKRRYLTEEQELLIISDYLDGKSQKDTGILNNVSAHIVCEVLKKHKIKIRNNSESKMKYSCNNSYFNTIDNEEKAYWLGFVAADGFLLTGKDHWGVTLSLRDKSHLEKLKDSLESNHPINEFIVKGEKEYWSCRLYIVSKEMKQSLVSKGIAKMKTSILSFPFSETVPAHLMNHFIRGYYDGDGSLFKDSHDRWYISVLGTEEFLVGLLNEAGIESSTIQDQRSIVKYISIGARSNVEKFLAYIYRDATTYLNRKYEKYQEYKRSSLEVIPS